MFVLTSLLTFHRCSFLGQGFQFCEYILEREDNFRKLFNILPLRIEGMKLNNVWHNSGNLVIVLVSKNSYYHYLSNLYLLNMVN